MAFAINGGTAFPICVYFGTSLCQNPSFGFPALLGPPVVRLPQKICLSGKDWILAHSLTEKDLG